MTYPDELKNLTDEEIANQARRDVAVFAELYQRHFPRVYRYHFIHCRSEADAQDLTTQTFLAALEGINGYRQRGSFAAWIMGIAKRKLALHFRKRKNNVPIETLPELQDPTPSPDVQVGQRLQLDHIHQALSRLKDERAEALMLCLVADLSAAEAAKVMGKSEAAVKMLVFRGLHDLRNKIAFPFQEEK